MNSRERLLAVLRHKEPDRIPWSPLVDYYFTSSLPDGLRMNTVETLRYIGADVMERYGQPFKIEYGGNITFGQEKKDDEIIRFWKTPRGNLVQIFMETETGHTCFCKEYPLKNLADIKIYRYVIEHTKFIPDFESFQKEDEYIGGDGMAVAGGPPSPLQVLFQDLMGIETTLYHLHDHKHEMEGLFNFMQIRHKESYTILAKSPAVIIIDYEDTSTSCLSPSLYEEYCIKEIDEYADIAHQKSKIFITHMCGLLKGLVHLIGKGKMDGIDSLSPLPTGDLDAAEARAILGEEKIIIGGISPPFLKFSSPDVIRSFIKDLLTRMSPGKNFILSTGDATPYGTPLENLKAVTETIKEFGRYPITSRIPKV